MNLSRRGFLGGASAFLVTGCRTLDWFGRPALAFGVISDTHVTTRKSLKLVDRAFAYFRSRGADAVMHPGDLTDWGLKSSLSYVKEAWDRHFAGTETVPLFCTGNHDFDGWRYADMTMEMHANGFSEDEHITRFGMAKVWKETFGEEYAPIRVRTVKGYDFVSAEWRDIAKIPDWMAAHGARFCGTKPFFYFQHSPIQGTTPDGAGWADRGAGYRALKDFPNAIAFTGHSHCIFNDERMAWQDAFTCFATPSLSYNCLPSGYENVGRGDGKTMPSVDLRRELRGGQGYYVSVYPDKMVVERIDIEEDCREAASAWIVPFGTDDRPLAVKTRAAASEPPAFPSGAAFDLETRNTRRMDGKWAIVMNCEFPSAEPAKGDRVFDYEIRAVPKDGTAPLVKKFLSPAHAYAPWREPARQRFWFDVTDLPQDTEYVLEARARNCFGKASAPLVSPVLRGTPGRQVPKYLHLVLTFDDGAKGHLTVAAPILEKYGFRGVFNIITGDVGKPGRLTWDDIRELKRRGHEIASHTVTHPNLVTLLKEGKEDKAMDELLNSRAAILRETGEAPEFLCAPYIAHDAALDAMVRKAGMRPMFGPRYNSGSETSLKDFQKRIDDLYERRTVFADLLFHGVSPESGGWSPIRSAALFEQMIRFVRERADQDLVEVHPYRVYANAFGPKA